MQSVSHCFFYPSEKATLQGSHKLVNISESHCQCLVLSALAGRKHSEGCWKTNEDFCLGPREERPAIKGKKALTVFVLCLQNQWISKWEQYVLAAWCKCRHGLEQSWSWLLCQAGSRTNDLYDLLLTGSWKPQKSTPRTPSSRLSRAGKIHLNKHNVSQEHQGSL